jgi:hypothetical protein
MVYDCVQAACMLHAGCQRSHAACLRRYAGCVQSFAACIRWYAGCMQPSSSLLTTVIRSYAGCIRSYEGCRRPYAVCIRSYACCKQHACRLHAACMQPAMHPSVNAACKSGWPDPGFTGSMDRIRIRPIPTKRLVDLHIKYTIVSVANNKI